MTMYMDRIITHIGVDENPAVMFEIDADYHLTDDGRGVLEAIHVYHEAHDLTPFLSDEAITQAEGAALEALSSKHPEAVWTPGEVV